MVNAESTDLPHNTRNIYVRDIIFRRDRYGTNCIHVAEERDRRYKEFSIDCLIPLAFYTTTSELEKCEDLGGLSEEVLRKYRSDQSDLLGDWQKYCKVLTKPLRAQAIFEGAIHLAANAIPAQEERHAWINQCLQLLNSLTRLLPADDSQGNEKTRQRKRKRGVVDENSQTSIQGEARYIDEHRVSSVTIQRPGGHGSLPAALPVEAPIQRVARMPEMAKLKAVVKGYIFFGMRMSCLRKREEKCRLTMLTDTVRLHLPDEGEDFKLEITVCGSVGDSITEALQTSMQDLKDFLGDYLFNGMDCSHYRESEKDKGIFESTAALQVFDSADDKQDKKLEVMLCFKTGKELYSDAFP